MSEFTERVAFVTGASRGLGRAIAQSFLEAGARVALVDLKLEWAQKALQEIGGTQDTALALGANVSDRAALTDAVAQTTKVFGGIDVLVNNAMWNRYDPIDALTEDTAQKMVNVGLLGVAWGIQAVLPSMRAREGGSIINISSMAGRLGISGALMYAGVKAGVDGMTRSASVELGRDKIRVNAVAPSTVATEGVRAMLDKETFQARVNSTPLCRLGETDDIAQTVLWLASDRASFITGQSIAVDGGLGHAFPR
ncbi:SDR family NAD(P)-dependent oxidoreductase [Pseudooceanicola nitratireducens]|uniref:SDR family NAD(P)-dependent oxidoreductase n=1 Tax=Pseudooceanicola nitratireducens TaxID=517719 RepID=UPI0023EFFF6C|nr:SDR family NAD(P)-dependent oxidoreductase [Pseudooceanicola nitratireducens]